MYSVNFLSKAKQSKAKQSKAKQSVNCALNQQFYFKTFLITLLSFLLLFSISCGKTPAEPEGVEVSEDFTESVPTATGNPATDLTNAYYRGTLSLTSIKN